MRTKLKLKAVVQFEVWCVASADMYSLMWTEGERHAQNIHSAAGVKPALEESFIANSYKVAQSDDLYPVMEHCYPEGRSLQNDPWSMGRLPNVR